MSWYLFKQSPAIQQRGKKVDGFNCMPKMHINLSWGMNDGTESRPGSNYSSVNNQNMMRDTVPATMLPPQGGEPQQNANNIKVLTDTSDDEQEELIKLIKAHKEKKIEQDVMEHFSKNRERGYSQQRSVDSKNTNKEDKSNSRFEMDKRIRYLENSLLPSSRRNSIATILDHGLNKEVPLEESRVSGVSVLHNKKNQSTFNMGEYNHFVPPEQKKKVHLDKLRDQYEYEQLCKKRMERSNIQFG